MENGFVGHGTLFIDAGSVDNNYVLDLDNNAEWYGLVIVHFREDVSLVDQALVSIWNNSRIVGGVVTYFSDGSLDFGEFGKVLKVHDEADVRYSSGLVADAPGVSTVVGQSARMTSYLVN